jgi:hypothetical protein
MNGVVALVDFAPDTPQSALILYDAAIRALAAARATDECKDIRARAEAMRAYARQAKNKQLEIDAAEIRIRAERRLGELIKAQKATVGLQAGARGRSGGGTRGSRKEPQLEAPPTLADAGIDKKLSARAQKLADLPESEFERRVAAWRARSEHDGITLDVLGDGRESSHVLRAMTSSESPSGTRRRTSSNSSRPRWAKSTSTPAGTRIRQSGRPRPTPSRTTASAGHGSAAAS